jgi:hypothetical protein
MSLENIRVWNGEYGWVSTTAGEASGDHPYGVPAAAEQFRCETCGQYVSFVAGNPHQADHFRHPAGSDDCDDKTVGPPGPPATTDIEFLLPLKIRLENDEIEVRIGFLPLTEGQMRDAESQNASLSILGIDGDNEKHIRKYDISERLSREHISYLSVGSEIYGQYRLDYSGITADSPYWPKKVNGIDGAGTLFDSKTGKRLQPGSNAVVGTEYMLLVKTGYAARRCPDIEIIPEKPVSGWMVYNIRAKCLSKPAYDFFHNRCGRVRLVDKTTEITHIWPPALYSSPLLLYSAQELWFYKEKGYLTVSPRRVDLEVEACFFTMRKSNFSQIMSISHSEHRDIVLDRTMIRYAENIKIADRELSIKLTNIRGNPIEPSERPVFPEENGLYVESEFDGFIEFTRGGAVIRQKPFKGGNEKKWHEIERNTTVRFFVGMDLVGEISFEKISPVVQEQKNEQKSEPEQENGNAGGDAETLARVRNYNGNSVKIDHTTGAIAARMRHMPKTKLWLLGRIRAGSIDKKALNLLTKILERS